MLSARSALVALVATSCIAQSDAFWLVPGSSRSHEVVQQESTLDRIRNAVYDKYNVAADVASSYVPTGSSKSANAAVAAASSSSVLDDVLRALNEVGTDAAYTASLAKGTLTRGTYLRQNDDYYLLSMDVPGLHTREVAVTAEKGQLKIKGSRKCSHIVGTTTVDPLCIERHYEASFTFPSDADESRADAKLDAGVVRVFVPKIKGEARGLGRVIKLSSDAADYVYEGTGAKYVVDGTTHQVNNAAEGVKNVYNDAAASAAVAYDTAAATAASAYAAVSQTAQDVVDNVVGSVKGATDAAQIAAADAAASARSAGHHATQSVKSAGHHATASAKSAGSQATDAASRASAQAAASASSISASAASASRHATASVKSAGHHATASAKSAASAATETPSAGFVERLHDQYVKPVKERIYSGGSAEGSIPVNKEEL
ncbi:hypothetical protein HKX48_002326 [Thoreauomyces humboldtii]|nr:hypothetical protein HKX48_002326 [Thoreauomyces humboldtii]